MMELSFLMQRIISDIYTKSQMRRRLRLLRDYLNFSLFTESTLIPFGSKIDSFVSLHPETKTDQYWLENLGGDFFGQFTRDNVDILLTRLEEEVKLIPIITIYIPFMLEEESHVDDKPHKDPYFVELGQWFKTNLGASYLFEINFNPELIGGCALSYRGIYKDYSLKSRLDTQKQIIAQSLTEYKR